MNGNGCAQGVNTDAASLAERFEQRTHRHGGGGSEWFFNIEVRLEAIARSNNDSTGNEVISRNEVCSGRRSDFRQTFEYV